MLDAGNSSDQGSEGLPVMVVVVNLVHLKKYLYKSRKSILDELFT